MAKGKTMDQEEYDFIKALLDAGEYQTEVANALGKSRTTVWRVASSENFEDMKRKVVERYHRYHKPRVKPVFKQTSLDVDKWTPATDGSTTISYPAKEPIDSWEAFTKQAPILDRVNPDRTKRRPNAS